MKKIIFILLLAVTFLGCSDDSDDDKSGSNPETFLEINKGALWKYTEDEDKDEEPDGFIYLKFNNINVPFESWASTQNSSENWRCYRHFNFTLNQYLDPILFFEIIENSLNKLTVRVTLRENHYQTNIFTKSGNRIRLQIIGDEMGHEYGGTYYYDKTSDNINGLEVCN